VARIKHPWFVWFTKRTPEVFAGNGETNSTGRTIRDGDYRYASLDHVRMATRVEAWANHHFAILEGLPLPSWPAQMTRDTSINTYEQRREEWRVVGDGQKAVRTFPGPMPEPPKKPAGPAPKPVLIPAEDLAMAWDLAWLMDPDQAVALIEQGRKVLRSTEATREWYRKAFGPDSLSLDHLMFQVSRGVQDPWNTKGYKEDPEAPIGRLKRLLRALGRNDHARAQAMLRHTNVRATCYRTRRNKKSGKITHTPYEYLISNGRAVRLTGVASRYTRDSLSTTLVYHAIHAGMDKSIVNYGWRVADAPSPSWLMMQRIAIAKRLQLARKLIHEHRATWEVINSEVGAREALLQKLKNEVDTIPQPTW
jgi:hypothetical protein